MIFRQIWGFIETMLFGTLTVGLLPFDITGSRFRWLFIHYWGRRLVWIAGLDAEVIGQDRVPEGPAVFVSNHRSTFDIILINATTTRPLRWISKRENAWVPFAGWAMWSMRCAFLYRDGTRRDRETLDRMAQELIPHQASVAIFPEGTRVRSGELGVFKKGAFHLAKQAGVQIVPMFVDGTERVKQDASTLSFKRHPVRAFYGTPITREEVASLSVDELCEKARNEVLRLQADASRRGHRRSVKAAQGSEMDADAMPSFG